MKAVSGQSSGWKKPPKGLKEEGSCGEKRELVHSLLGKFDTKSKHRSLERK